MHSSLSKLVRSPSTPPPLLLSSFYPFSFTLAGCAKADTLLISSPDTLTHASQMKLPDSTVVLNGHEYTSGSAAFGASVEPSNAHLASLVAAAKKGNTVLNGYTIGDEKKWNVFVRTGEEAVKAKTGTSDPVKAVGKLREMKNNF